MCEYCRCLNPNIFGVLQEYGEENVFVIEIRSRFLDHTSHAIKLTLNLSRLKWLGHALCMPADRLLRFVLHSDAGSDQKTSRSDRSMTWRKGVKTLLSELS